MFYLLYIPIVGRSIALLMFCQLLEEMESSSSDSYEDISVRSNTVPASIQKVTRFCVARTVHPRREKASRAELQSELCYYLWRSPTPKLQHLSLAPYVR